MTDKLEKAKHIDEKLKGINQSRNEALKEMRKRPWSRRGFLKGALIGASFIAISVLGHSLLRPGITVADTLPGNGAVESPLPGKARLILVFILDGLRPDSINPDDTPNLFRLRQEGVNYVNGHSVFPTVTRVNAAAMATGTVVLQKTGEVIG